MGYANARIEYAELRNVGQQTDLGRYPIHFHLCLDKIETAEQPYIRGNSIHNSFARCVTIHGSHGVLVRIQFSNFKFADISIKKPFISCFKLCLLGNLFVILL